MTDPVLELRDVFKQFGAFTAVDNLSFEVGPGSICGLLGPNGAGKTTTIRMILEILRPTSGSIRVLGSPSALKVRDRIGYLPEEKGLYKKMKAWAIIAYFATLKGLPDKTAKLKAFELLERYGLKDFAEARTEALSKGMGQKVQVLASIAHDPEFVILDEPFSGLDPVNQLVMEEVIRDLAARARTIIFSTHVMQHAERLCDRILLISRGAKVFDGTVAQAKARAPRTLRLATADPVDALHSIRGVHSLAPAQTDPADTAPPATDAQARAAVEWELKLSESADPQSILQACFDQRIRLQRFEQVNPTLHDVFLQLVGEEAREARFR